VIKAALLVGLGSFLGGSLRFLSVVWIERKASLDFPLAILCVNALGSFVIGFAAPGFERFSWGGESVVPLLLSAGMMGGFTTFSTFSLQTLKLMQNGNWGLAFLNAIASVVCCLLSVWAGWRLGQWAFR